MNVEFKDKNLKQLYEKGKNKKYRLPDGIKKKFFMRIDQLEAAKTIYDLWESGALNFEKLQGYENRFSLRLNVQWRLEIEIAWENRERTTGTVHITTLSKHYGG